MLEDAEVEEYRWLGEDESGEVEAEDATTGGIVSERRGGCEGRSWTGFLLRIEDATKDGQGG